METLHSHEANELSPAPSVNCLSDPSYCTLSLSADDSGTARGVISLALWKLSNLSLISPERGKLNGSGARTQKPGTTLSQSNFSITQFNLDCDINCAGERVHFLQK